jgi:hypothetical protein
MSHVARFSGEGGSVALQMLHMRDFEWSSNFIPYQIVLSGDEYSASSFQGCSVIRILN